mmetsp:Transcript_23441/g.36680  ORF Transcript_23441/g.36680 Transcript_23441/m.36680 type:complete len:286 (+) Transcript_23441:288-1145(+)
MCWELSPGYTLFPKKSTTWPLLPDKQQEGPQANCRERKLVQWPRTCEGTRCGMFMDHRFFYSSARCCIRLQRFSLYQWTRIIGHLRFFYNTLALLVLLTFLEGFNVFPPKNGLTAVAIDVGHCVKPSYQNSIFFWSQSDVHNIAEQIGPAMPALKGFGDNLVMLSQVRPTVATTVDAGPAQVNLEHLAHFGKTAGSTSPQPGRVPRAQDCCSLLTRAKSSASPQSPESGQPRPRPCKSAPIQSSSSALRAQENHISSAGRRLRGAEDATAQSSCQDPARRPAARL